MIQQSLQLLTAEHRQLLGTAKRNLEEIIKRSKTLNLHFLKRRVTIECSIRNNTLELDSCLVVSLCESISLPIFLCVMWISRKINESACQYVASISMGCMRKESTNERANQRRRCRHGDSDETT